MSKNSDYAATMYEADPRVAALNKVTGFDPLKLMQRGTAKGSSDLGTRYKKLWFRLAHREGRIRLNALKITDQLAIYEAQVYFDRSDQNPVTSFTATCTREEAVNGKYIEGAQERAMDQALTDAGFGLQFVPAPTGGQAVQIPALTSTGEQAVQAPAPAQTLPSAKSVQTAKAVQSQPNRPSRVTKKAELPAPAPEPASELPAGAETLPAGQLTASTEALPAEQPAVNTEALPAEQLPVNTETLPAEQLTANTEALPAEQLPVSAGQQGAFTANDMMAAMSMLSGKIVPDSLPVMQENTADGKEAQVLPAASEPAASAAPMSEAPQANRVPYTDATPVDEIRKLMTLDDAMKVVVPDGTCRGWTLERVARDRAASLKYYTSIGYTGKSNILRAAAGIVMEDLKKKAG